jgi:hypothetical protein
MPKPRPDCRVHSDLASLPVLPAPQRGIDKFGSLSLRETEAFAELADFGRVRWIGAGTHAGDNTQELRMRNLCVVERVS